MPVLSTTRPDTIQTGLFMIRRQCTVTGDLNQEGNRPLETFYYKVIWGGGIHPQSLWGSEAVAQASQLVCAKFLRLCFLQGVKGWSHYKLDGDGGTQFMWGCDLGFHCNISRSDDIISHSDE